MGLFSIFTVVITFGSPFLIFHITLIQTLTVLTITAYAVPTAEIAFVTILAIAYI